MTSLRKSNHEQSGRTNTKSKMRTESEIFEELRMLRAIRSSVHYPIMCKTELILLNSIVFVLAWVRGEDSLDARYVEDLLSGLRSNKHVTAILKAEAEGGQA